MGVQQFNKAFGECAVPIKNIKDVIHNKDIIIDINLCLCSAIKAMFQGTHLTDSNGIPTAGINALFSNILKFRNAGARVKAVFDNPEKNPFKQGEYEKRRQRRDESKAKADEADDDEEKKKHDAAAWVINSAVIEDAQHLLNLMGVEYHIAPLGREAEQYAADMAKAGWIDIVITNDTDAVMFGAPIVIMSNTTKTANKFPWVMYKLNDILEKYNIDLNTFQKMCVLMGTDFAPKANGIGPKTIFTSGKNKQLSAEQQIALDYIQSDNKDRAHIVKSSFNKDAIIKWLVEKKGFNEKRITAQINK